MHTAGHVPETTLEAAAERQPEQHAAREMVAILDYGSQYSRLIARRVRECRVYCELLPADATLDELRRLGAKGVILSGGPDSVYDEGARRVDPAILKSELPVLGICYGMQLLANQLGGRVEPHTGRREYGPAQIAVLPQPEGGETLDALFAGGRNRSRGVFRVGQKDEPASGRAEVPFGDVIAKGEVDGERRDRIV